MKQKSIYIIFILLFLSACSYSKFTITGVPYSPLPDDTEINIVEPGDLKNYDEIGIAEIKNSDTEFRLEEAKRYARMYGGTIVMQEQEEGNSKVGKFRVLYPATGETVDVKKQPAEDFAEEFQEPDEGNVKESPKQVKKEHPDYSNLPVVPYKILTGEIPGLNGENFQAAMYPKKTIISPKALSSYVGKNILLEVNSKKGDNPVYLIVDKINYKRFQKAVTVKKGVKFVYTPVVLYDSKYPVLKFVDFVY